MTFGATPPVGSHVSRKDLIGRYCVEGGMPKHFGEFRIQSGKRHIDSRICGCDPIFYVATATPATMAPNYVINPPSVVTSGAILVWT